MTALRLIRVLDVLFSCRSSRQAPGLSISRRIIVAARSSTRTATSSTSGRNTASRAASSSTATISCTRPTAFRARHEPAPPTPGVRALMRQPWNMIASDGAYSDGVRSRPGQHPRSTGTFPRVLGRYVREWQVITLEDAVRKMTSLPAEFLGLDNRGRLAEGNVADITVFDPATIIDNSTWDEPHLFSTGVIHVLVNGTAVLRDAEMTGEAPGAFLQR